VFFSNDAAFISISYQHLEIGLRHDFIKMQPSEHKCIDLRGLTSVVQEKSKKNGT